MSNVVKTETVRSLLTVIRELLHGNTVSRQTISSLTGKSLATADRWLDEIEETLPDIRRTRDGKAREISYDWKREAPTKPAVVGACIAASLAGVLEGTQHERNLKDARDYLLRLRGVKYDNLDRKFFFAPRGGEYALPEGGGDLDEIVDALLETRQLNFNYRTIEGVVEKRSVEPLSLVIFEHQFYLLARKQDGALRSYRFARMSDVDAQPEAFTYPTKIEFNPQTILEPLFGIHLSATGPVEDIEVVLSGDWATYALDHRWHMSQQTTRLEDGRVRVTIRVRLCPEVDTWILGFGELAVVTKPEALAQRIADKLSKARDLYVRTVGPSLAKAEPAPSGSPRDVSNGTG